MVINDKASPWQIVRIYTGYIDNLGTLLVFLCHRCISLQYWIECIVITVLDPGAVLLKLLGGKLWLCTKKELLNLYTLY